LILGALLVFRLAGEAVSPAAEAGVPRAVGSLQKPWVVAAWAEAHPDDAPPRVDCTAASGCWRPAGHGRVDLARAFAGSCNTWFLALARATPPDALARALAGAGFDLPRTLTPEAAIGLGPLEKLPRVSPARLLRAYRDLLTRPWPARDDLRLALVDGMRAAAREGTGAGLGRRGAFVKTGTVPALDGRPLATSGWALAADASGGMLHLALLADGTGAGAAAALGRELRAPDGARAPARGTATERPLRVRLLDPLRPESVAVSNVGSSPARVRRARGRASWLGPGAALRAEPGVAIGPGLLRLAVAPYGLVRFVEGTLEVSGRPGALALVLSATARAWVDGVLRGELRGSSPELHAELAAAALRFLRAGPRHGKDDLCDATHCAHFVGRGPLVTWVTPSRAEGAPGTRAAPPPPLLDDATWHAAVALAETPGPSSFTGHCGGAPLSPFEVWGSGPREASPCPRHSASDAERWERFLPSAALEGAFGPVSDLRAVVVGGVRITRLVAGGRERDLLYDDLHRALAPALGWDALPSPPDAFEAVPGGFRARGRGRGHRVGLCLAPGPR